MHFVNIRDFRLNSSSILHESGEDPAVVTYRGKPVALLVYIDETHLETMIHAIRAARLRTTVDKLRDAARRSGADEVSAARVAEEIRSYRKSKRA
ncbi:MAG: type II toxin-antitoxin system Phd/YefM family antitoxin [Elusimicrobiota bacterium]